MVKDLNPQSGGERFKSFHLQPKYNLGVLFVYPYLSCFWLPCGTTLLGQKIY
jgi:hypothetical protein